MRARRAVHVAGVVAFALLALVVAGCGNGDDDDASDAGARLDASTGDATTGARDSAPPPSSDASADAATDAAADAGDADADVDGGACTALFCDDFETGMGDLDGGPWTVDVGYAQATAVTITTEKPAHGLYSAHAHVDASGGFAYLRTTVPFPALATDLWGRASVFHDVPATVGHNALVSGDDGLEVGQGNGDVQLNYYPPGGGERPVGYPTAITEGTWVCLEWHMEVASPQIELYQDGVLLATYVNSSDAGVPAMTAIRLGLETHSANPASYDVYLDDVAMGSKRVGCP